MIIGAEIALLFIGLYALIKGQLPTSKKAKHVVRGWPARVIGIIALLPIPVSFGLGLAVALLFVVQRKQVTGDSFFWVGTAIEGSVLGVCFVAIAVLSRVYRIPVEQPRLEEGFRAGSPDPLRSKRGQT